MEDLEKSVSLVDTGSQKSTGHPVVALPDLRIKFTGSNVFLLKKLVELTLKARGLINHLSDNPMELGSPMRKTWDAEEALIHSWLLSNMLEELMEDYICVTTVKEIWNEVMGMCSKEHNDWRIYDLLIKVKQIKQGELSVVAYSSKLKAIWREIDFYWPVENPHSQERKNELKVRMFAFLMGLNSEYENLVSQLIHREKLPNLDEAIGEIVKVESRKGVSVESSQGGVSSSSAAFISKTPASSLNSNSAPRLQHQEISMKNSTLAGNYSQDKETDGELF